MSRELILSVKRSRFRSDDPNREHADSKFKSVSGKVRERDGYTCQYCGFVAKKWQEVHHLNDCHSDNSESNLITACPLCHLSNHIGFAGVKSIGRLIYIDPSFGISQPELNQLVRSLWIARDSGNTSMRQIASVILSELQSLSDDAESILGSADPLPFADFLLGLSAEDYADRKKYLNGIYLLPDSSGFERQLSYWIECKKATMPTKWTGIVNSRCVKWLKNEGFEGEPSEQEVLEYLLAKNV